MIPSSSLRLMPGHQEPGLQTEDASHVGPSATTNTTALPTSVRLGELTFNVGDLRTTLSENEKQLLSAVFHPDMQKTPLADMPDANGMMSFTIGANDYVSGQHLPRSMALPEKMLVTIKLDQALNLERLMMTDLKDIKDPPHAYCNARFEASTLPHQLEKDLPPPFSASHFARPSERIESFSQFSQNDFTSQPVQASDFFTSAPSGGPYAPGPTRPSASDQQIRQQLKKEDGTLRTGQEVLAQLRRLGLGTDTSRVYAMLRNEKGPTIRKNVSEDEIRPYLRDAQGGLLSRRAVETALRANGIGASAVRINTMLQAEKAINSQRATASASSQSRNKLSDSQIKAYLTDANGKLRTRREVEKQLHAAGLQANNTRINSLLQAERGVRLRPSATDDQIREYLTHPDGSFRKIKDVVADLNEAGLGASNRRVGEMINALKQ